ncbi:MAG: hypothetical protein NXI07_13425 [bacterium]|nr:hypothetical protein [bacterium]
MARRTRTESRTLKTPAMLIASAALTLSTLGGCVSYTNVPEPESAPAFKSANHLQAKKVTHRALEEVVSRYPMHDSQGRYSINLPAGTSLESAQEIVDGLPDGVVIPFEGMDQSIPTYHIGRIWIRASDAKVDVLYPARSFDGSAFTGNVTVWLNGGIRRWGVNRVQHWAPGTIEVPPIYVPIPEEELEMMGDTESDEQSQPEPVGEQQPAHDTPAENTAPDEPAREPAPSEPGDPYREVPVDD